MAKRARDLSLILHIGLHKTATSYVQNLWGARRYDLMSAGVLYPTTGTTSGLGINTREGAQSGQTLFTKPGDRSRLVEDLLGEAPESVSTMLMSAEDFSLGRMTPEAYLGPLSAFGSVAVVLVLRRQDTWIQSVYKQLVDQYMNFETRPFDAFLAQQGPALLDFHARFSPWRELVGAENFHAISYDDVAGGAAISEAILRIAGLENPLPETAANRTVPRYESVRAIDTVGLRVLNTYRLTSRDVRNRTARRIYDLAPAGDITLLTEQMREGIEKLCTPINQRIEAEWFTEPVPGLCFGREIETPTVVEPTTTQMLAYLDQVIAVCEDARGFEADQARHP